MAVVHIKADDFNKEVIESELPVLVDFWASWCGPCKALSPVLEEVDSEIEGKAKICKVNVDEEGALAAQFGIMSIPTMVFFENGEETNRLVGVRMKDDIMSALVK